MNEVIVEKDDFSQAYLQTVQDFDCGEEPWASEVASWIKAQSDGALDLVTAGVCRVWVYLTAEGTIVGYGSLGPSLKPWSLPNWPKAHIPVVPFMGVRRQYQHLPEGPPENRHAARILRDIIGEAANMDQVHPLLGLCVDPRNTKAIAFYERANFRLMPEQYTCGGGYRKMYVVLPTRIRLRQL